MKKVFKYPLSLHSVTQLIPFENELDVLYVGLDPQGIPHVWVLVDSDLPSKPIIFYVVGTEHDLPQDATHYVGSYADRLFMWHVFV